MGGSVGMAFVCWAAECAGGWLVGGRIWRGVYLAQSLLRQPSGRKHLWSFKALKSAGKVPGAIFKNIKHRPPRPPAISP